MTSDKVYDVIVSGAGPVGLFLACELALAKCSVLILEKAEAPQSPLKRIPFGIRGLSTPTIEALDRRGLLDELEVPKRLKDPAGTPKAMLAPQATRQAGHFAGIPFHYGNVDSARWLYRLPSSTDNSLMAELEELETVLTRRAEALGVDIKRGLATADFQQDDAGVKVIAAGRSFAGKWLVGCDGSRSAVRKAAGIEFAGTEPEFTGYTAKVDLADPEKLKPGRNVTPTGIYVQSQPGYFGLQDFDGGAFHGSGEPLTLARVQAVLRRVSNTDVTLTALHIATTWTDRARQATKYRQGRVFLAGDAAHIHSPLGGQGLNLGLGDAMNLGWKLAATIHGHAPEGLLDSYHAERYPLGAQVLEWSRAQVALMRPDHSTRALYAVVRDLLATRDGATYIASRVWGVHTSYRLGGELPLVGHSVPNFEFADGTKLGELMRDGRGMIIDFAEEKSLEALASSYGGRIKYVSGRADQHLALSTLLVRPDGIVAWASDDRSAASAIKPLIEQWF